MSARSWMAGTWLDVDAGDWVLGNDGYTYLVTAMATVGDDTHVWIARPGRAFDFPLDAWRKKLAVKYHRPQSDPQVVDDAIATLARFEVQVDVIDASDVEVEAA